MPVYKLNCDLNNKIKTFLVEEFEKNYKDSKMNSFSKFLTHFLDKYLQDGGDWFFPDKFREIFDSYGEDKFNNLSFYIPVELREKLDKISAKSFRDNKGTIKHFIYSLYYRMNKLN